MSSPAPTGHTRHDAQHNISSPSTMRTWCVQDWGGWLCPTWFHRTTRTIKQQIFHSGYTSYVRVETGTAGTIRYPPRIVRLFITVYRRMPKAKIYPLVHVVVPLGAGRTLHQYRFRLIFCERPPRSHLAVPCQSDRSQSHERIAAVTTVRGAVSPSAGAVIACPLGTHAYSGSGAIKFTFFIGTIGDRCTPATCLGFVASARLSSRLPEWALST